MKTLPILAALLLVAAGAARADADASAGWRHCRALADAAARLACYDALPDGAASAAAPPGTAPEPTLAQRQAAFGLPEAASGQLQEVVTFIPGHFEGWDPGTVITLGNGQVWQITDDTSAAYLLDNPRVTVRRAAFGSFMLDIEGARRTPRARRLR